MKPDISTTQSIVAPLMVPPDGGWGWVIVSVGTSSGIIMDGINFSSYLLREPMSSYLGIHPSQIAILASLFTGFYSFGGIVACSAGNHWGFRIVMVTGAVVACLCFASGYILEDIFHFYIVIGFLGGIATGFIFVASALPTGFYFDKKRSIAMGFVSCGSGIGAIIMPQVTELFMEHNGWRLTFLFHAGLIGLLIFLGFLIRPLEPVGVVLKANQSLMSLFPPNESRPVSTDFSTVRQIPSTTDNVSEATDYSAPTDPVSYPTISQVVHDTDAISIRVRSSLAPSVVTRLHNLNQSRTLQLSASQITGIMIEEEEEEAVRLPWYKCGCCRREKRLPVRPLQRTDLYYTGSLHRLTEFTEKEKDLEYHLEVTKVPTYFEVMQDVTQTYTRWCCHNFLLGLRTLLDYRLLKSPTFVCLALCGFAQYFAFYLPFLYGKVHLDHMGQGQYATTLVSIIGLGNTAGRISSGIIVTLCPKFGARLTTSFTTFTAGLMVISSTIHPSIVFQFGCMLIYGFTGGFYAPLRSIIIVDFFGLNILTSATGMMILFQGLGSFSGAPVAEAVLKLTNNKNSPYYVCGGVLMFASMILLPMEAAHKREKKRKRQRSRTTTLTV